MDEMKIQSALMTGLVSTLIRKTLRKKLGYDIDIQINNVKVSVSDGKASIHMDADAEIETNELMRIAKNIC